jgi:anthranilate phosphoribosyltransferase
MMVRDILNGLIDGRSLDAGEAAALMASIMDEELTHIQLAGVLVALRAKGETPDEIVGFAQTMRDRARPIEVGGPLADTCGTGGDNRGTFNISTAAALIVASTGQRVAKHGNRAASGQCGSADVLEALGVDVALPPEGVIRCIEGAGMGFLFAPAFHPATKFAAITRKELAVRTIFNVLGPLTNPARPQYQLLGVSNPHLLDLLAEALLKLGVEAALVVHSQDGMDEISVSGSTSVREVRGGEVRAYEVTPEDFGVPRALPESLRGGDIEQNAAMLLDVLRGRTDARRDAAVINAGATLYASGRASTLAEGARLAEGVLDSGAALAILDRLRDVSRGARAEVDERRATSAA